MNFCRENKANFKFLSSRRLIFSIVSAASITEEFTSLQNGEGKRALAQITHAWVPHEKKARTHLRFTLDLIILFKFSVVTSASPSSLSENIAGGSFSFRLRHNCRITSSTVRVGSIRARTVTPSFVVTWFVGTTVFPCFVPLWLEVGPFWKDEFTLVAEGFEVMAAIVDRMCRGLGPTADT